MRSCGVVLASFSIVTVGAPGALANGTGGVSVLTTAANKTTHTTNIPPGAAPVTAKSTSITYTGPVYEKTATGTVVPYAASTSQTQTQVATGGAAVAATSTEGKPELLVPGSRARFIDGLAAAPMSAPAAVQEIIWAGDQIVGLPYIYGGGHGSFVSPGYDCSGTVSFALHGAVLLASPEDSSELMGWGGAGEGEWVTLFSNPGHVYMTVAGLRLDTSAAYDPSDLQGPRWRPLRPNNVGYTVRHPIGL